MKNKNLSILIAAAIVSCTQVAKAQTAFGTIEYLDVNNIKSAIMVHGDMWWDPATSEAKCEFPKGSGKSISHASGLWMGGYDAGNNLHVSAQTYRQTGSDYWPGPLDANDTLTYATSEQWARIWKVNLSDITTYLARPVHTIINTPASILEWPSKGNPYAKGNSGTPLTITEDMAPFIDADNDGMYDPLAGDYPDIKGDQALWWVFSDNGATHDNSSNTGIPLKVEIHAMAYAYSRGKIQDNMQYYNYTVYNKSANDYTKFRMGIYADVDLGAFIDDYIGFDSSRRMGITYNGKSTDGNGAPGDYGINIPQMGITMLEMPGDNGQVLKPVGSFMYYNNDLNALGNPDIDADYYNYLNATWRDGQHLKNDFTMAGTPSQGRGAGPDVDYAFPGNPMVDTEWSECSSQNPYGDRRFIIATSDYEFSAGSSTSFTFALIATAPAPDNGCPDVDFTDLQTTADSAWSKYIPPTGIAGVSSTPSLKLYPNPANDEIYIEVNAKTDDEVMVFDIMGKRKMVKILTENNKTTIDIRHLPTGMYTIRYKNGQAVYTNSFIKE